MIKNYFKHDASGRILQAGCCTEEDFALQAEAGSTLREGVADPFAQYWDGSAVVDMPPSPSPHHIFDYPSKQWVDPRTLDAIKEQHWEKMKLARTAEEYGGFTYAGQRYDSDAVSQARITGAVSLAMMAASAGQPFWIEWTLADNTTTMLNDSAMMGLGMTLGQFVAGVHAKGRSIRAAIEAATSVSEVEAVTWV